MLRRGLKRGREGYRPESHRRGFSSRLTFPPRSSPMQSLAILLKCSFSPKQFRPIFTSFTFFYRFVTIKSRCGKILIIRSQRPRKLLHNLAHDTESPGTRGPSLQ
jgi:hypothetical protein